MLILASSAARARFASNPKGMSRVQLSDKDLKDYEFDYLDVAKLQLERMSEDMRIKEGFVFSSNLGLYPPIFCLILQPHAV
ncbi:unnamed protein product [Heligmosomoides polygyrus]|uniref:TORC_N domain-containing protein n=1 Tax=Heligmosomoides polygyrus TaxID=6339 RepID=A0A183G3S5_HELPZ|nr:unnamed protein product [Heligmosomoides polygyrus]